MLFTLVCKAGASADAWAVPDTTRITPSGPVPTRSTVETAVSLPGKVLYVPAWGAFALARGLAVAVWDWRLPDRAAAALTFADGRLGVRPESSTQIGTGARAFYRHRLARLDVVTSFGRQATERRYHLFELQGTGWRVDGGYRREHDESFYGVGMAAPKAARERFAHEQLGLRLSVPYQLDGVQITWRAGVRSVAVEVRDAVASDVAMLPGGASTTRLIDAEVAVRLQSVDRAGSPRDGQILRAGAGLHVAVDDPLSYISMHAACEHFMDLFYRRALSMRIGTDWRVPLGNDEVPFFDLASVGGNQFVRGFQRGRFRDRGSVVGAIAYKVPVWRMLDSILFYEGGRTFHEINHLTFRGWRQSWGTGMRLYVPNRMLFEQRVAFSSEEWRLLFLARTDF